MDKPTASALELTAKCNRSWREQQRKGALPNVSGEAAKIGSAVHAVLANKDGWHSGICEAHGVKKNRKIVDKINSLGAKYHQIMPPAGAEATFEFRTSYGTADVVIDGEALGGGRLITIIDFKSGWGDVPEPESNLQGAAYAVGVAEKIGNVAFVLFHLLRANYKEDPPPARYLKEDIQKVKDVIDALRDRAVSPRANYSPGEHCLYCRARNICPALNRSVTPMFKSIVSGKTLDLSAMDDEGVAQAYDRLKVIKNERDRIEDAVKAEITARGGVDCGDGTRLIRKDSTRYSIDTRLGFNIAKDIADEDFADAVTISKAVLEDLAASRAARGKKEEARKEVFKRLRDADALIKSTSVRFKKEKIQ